MAKYNVRPLEIDPRKLKLLEVNARYMKQETFQRLVANVRRDGHLDSAPLVAAWKRYTADDPILTHPDGTPIYEVLSGNHRTRAAIEAGLPTIIVLAIDEPIPRQERIAKQLSHNAIEGEDDPATLKRLYEELDVDWKQYAGLDDKTLELLQKVSIDSIGEANLEYLNLSVVFLPEELDRVRAVWESVKKLVKGDETWLARWRDYDRLLDQLDDVGASYGVKNSATVLMLMLDLVERHLDELAAGWYDPESAEPLHKGWVPLASILGSGKVPASAAQAVKRAVDRLAGRGHIPATEPWRALEFLSLVYLGDVELPEMSAPASTER